MTGECSRCSECCRVLPLSIHNMHPAYLHYLRTRGVEEDQGFILIPHDCQHLIKNVKWGSGGSAFEYACDIHESPDRPEVCRKYHGQKRIGNAQIYIPPSCTMRNKESD